MMERSFLNEVAVNGEWHAVPEHQTLQSLSDFIGTSTRSKAPRVSCGEGGCGSCAVEVSIRDPDTDRLASFHASQCGFCTPGFVVAANQVIRRARAAGRSATAGDFAAGFDGNLCRCTGYRPIIDACKSMAGCKDVEDLGICAPHGRLDTVDSEAPVLSPPCVFPSHALDTQFDINRPQIPSDGNRAAVPSIWKRPRVLSQLLEIVSFTAPSDLRLVAGNTGAGVYKNWPAEAVILDVRGVRDLSHQRISVQGALEVGAARSIADVIEALQQGSSSVDDGWSHMARHLLRIAGTHVRNAATVGGNLALARERRLESDLATVLMGAGAVVQFVDLDTLRDACDIRSTSVEVFLSLTEPRLLVVGVSIPPFGSKRVFRSQKVAHRFHNSHALFNAALSFRTAADGRLSKVRVAVGQLDSMVTGQGIWSVKRVPSVERRLAQGRLTSIDTLCAALRGVAELSNDAHGNASRCDEASTAAHAFNQQMLQAFILNALAPFVQLQGSLSCSGQVARLLRTAMMQPPGVGSGHQDWPCYDADDPPVHLPVEKDAVRLQASGEAVFTSDVVGGQGQLYAATVASTRALALIIDIDVSPASKVPGFVAFIGSRDVPEGGSTLVLGDALFASTKVEYCGQRIGLAVATTQRAADQAAKAVHVTYCSWDGGKAMIPVLTLDDAEQADSYHDIQDSVQKRRRGERAVRGTPHVAAMADLRSAHKKKMGQESSRYFMNSA